MKDRKYDSKTGQRLLPCKIQNTLKAPFLRLQLNGQGPVLNFRHFEVHRVLSTAQRKPLYYIAEGLWRKRERESKAFSNPSWSRKQARGR